MPRAFHNLAGLCRDLRAAALAAAEGNQEAYNLCVALDDAMELHDALISGDMDDGQDSDAAASGDDAEDESDPLPRREGKRDKRVGDGGEGTAIHSTRARAELDRRPSRQRQREQVATRSCEARAVPTAGPRNGGKR